MNVAQGYCAGTAASCGTGIGTLTAARHAVILRQAVRVGVCCALSSTLPLSWMNIKSYNEELDEKLVDWKMSLKTLKTSKNFISLSNKYLPIELEKHPSCFHLQKTSVAPQFTHLFIHLVVCLTTGPQHPPPRVLHRVSSSAPYFNS